jgi:hypothetical protein
MVFPCHHAVVNRRVFGGRAKAISYLVFKGCGVSLETLAEFLVKQDK